VILRLWWRCTLCGWRVDTFGVSHDNGAERSALGFDVLDHLETRHRRQMTDLRETASLFEPKGSVRPRKRRVLVQRDRPGALPPRETVSPLLAQTPVR
jgi:hypothetical protein